MNLGQLKNLVRDVPDFPKEGIIFKDITPILKDPKAFRFITSQFAQEFAEKNFDVIVGVESRGFLFGSVLAHELNKPLAIVRKKGKLPYVTVSFTYQLEYGEDTIEMHEDAIAKGSKVLIVDDLLATGGTSEATAKLIEKMGGEVAAMAFVIELDFLKGRERLQSYPVFSLLHY